MGNKSTEFEGGICEIIKATINERVREMEDSMMDLTRSLHFEIRDLKERISTLEQAALKRAVKDVSES